jgi:glycosyltransferase involved in cell wall biosynthesis
VNHFKIVIPAYNVSKWVERTIESVLIQDFKDFECVFIDDMSTDNTVELVKGKIKNDQRFKIIQNTEKKYGLRNYYEGINFLKPRDNDIIITLDGDDWFPYNNVLTKVNEIYEKKQCWLTYGSYMNYPSRMKSDWIKQPSFEIVENSLFRSSDWVYSHLRTFKYGLFKRIDIKDFKDMDGKWFEVSWDLAFMFPMLEMAGHKVVYLSDVLYVYNIETENNDYKVRTKEVRRMDNYIRSLPKYKRINEL